MSTTWCFRVVVWHDLIKYLGYLLVPRDRPIISHPINNLLQSFCKEYFFLMALVWSKYFSARTVRMTESLNLRPFFYKLAVSVEHIYGMLIMRPLSTNEGPWQRRSTMIVTESNSESIPYSFQLVAVKAKSTIYSHRWKSRKKSGRKLLCACLNISMCFCAV